MSGLLRGLFDGGATAEDDQVGEGNLLAVGGAGVERLLDASEELDDLSETGGLVGLPVLLRCEADASAVGAAALVGAAVGGSRGPSRRDEFGEGKP